MDQIRIVRFSFHCNRSSFGGEKSFHQGKYSTFINKQIFKLFWATGANTILRRVGSLKPSYKFCFLHYFNDILSSNNFLNGNASIKMRIIPRSVNGRLGFSTSSYVFLFSFIIFFSFCSFISLLKHVK